MLSLSRIPSNFHKVGLYSQANVGLTKPDPSIRKTMKQQEFFGVRGGKLFIISILQYIDSIIMTNHKIWHETEKSVKSQNPANISETDRNTYKNGYYDNPFGIPFLRDNR